MGGICLNFSRPNRRLSFPISFSNYLPNFLRLLALKRPTNFSRDSIIPVNSVFQFRRSGGAYPELIVSELVDKAEADCEDVDMAVNMTLNGCYAPMLYKPHMLNRPHDNKFRNVPFLDAPQSYRKNRVSFPVWSGTPQKNLVCGSLKGMKLSCRSYASSSFIRGEPEGLPHSIPILPRRGEAGGLTDTMPELPRRKQLYSSTRVSKGIAYSHRYTAAEKPEWWWRVLSCLPYLVPLHAPWMNPELLYQMHPFLENFEFLTYPFLRAYIKLPSFVIMACISGLIIGVVRRRECPHSFRFHVVMGILLESCMHIMGTVSGWLPCEVFWGKFGNLFWSAIAFGYLFTVVECMRCAIAGKYPDIAVLSDAALTHIPYR